MRNTVNNLDFININEIVSKNIRMQVFQYTWTT